MGTLDSKIPNGFSSDVRSAPKGRLSLRARIYLILALLVGITLMGGAVMVWYTFQMDRIVSGIVDRDIAAFQFAEALETALINQKGFVSYYFLDGDPEWLRKLGEYRRIFRDRLEIALKPAGSDPERNIIEQVASEYGQYTAEKDRVIELHQKGDQAAREALHRSVRFRFFNILDLCEKYKSLHTDRINRAAVSSRSQAWTLRVIAAAAMAAAFSIAAILAFVLIFQVLGPIRRLSLETGRTGGDQGFQNEIQTLQKGVEGLLEDVDQTQIELKRSREHLLQAEKMAMVGKLAAGMAHSIRNPFTSVKMRLFSLSRTLKLSASQNDDFTVISEEIRHIDQIVQNFLEFSRPPKLKMQSVRLSAVVENALQLLEHRIKFYDVDIRVSPLNLPVEVEGDPEQLKEVLVNLIVNACEAMGKGGSILIEEGFRHASAGPEAFIRMRDSGPGIPESIREKVFQPFFTTKDEGTGLGLSIAARIMEEHGGKLDLESNPGKGATFTLTLPVNEAGGPT
jgi:signal transduction histidine kinase